MTRAAPMTIALCLPAMLFAAIEPLAPVDCVTVPLVPDAQKKVMDLPTRQERIELLQWDRKNGKKIRHDPYWRKARPLVLELKTTAGENGPWKIQIGKRADLSDARTWYVKESKTDKATGREEEKSKTKRERARIEVPRANLEIATRYYWKVSCRGRCGFGCHRKHGCEASKRMVETSVSSFVTEDRAPRWIALEGRVENVRDFGGRIGRDGRRVRQGLAYRGQGLNDNSVTGEVQGRSRLMVEDVKYLKETLGIRTDLDLRGIGETADLQESPLGAGVAFVRRPSQSYREIFSDNGKKAMAKNFRLFCDRKNYPIYFHCIGGADRTGSLAYMMNGVLGVSLHEAETDWESTFYPRIPDENPDPEFWCQASHFDAGLAKYGDDKTSWNDRVVLYLKDCGITDDEIAAFREIMLEKK